MSFGLVSGWCPYMAPSLHNAPLTYTCGLHSKLSFLDGDFWKCSHAVMPSRESCLFLMQCCLRVWGSPASFNFVPCAQTLLLNLLMILCTVYGSPPYTVHNIIKRFNVFAILYWETFFWNCFTIFRCSLFQIGEPLPIFKALFPWIAPFIPSHVTDLLPINLISCQIVLLLFLICINYFSSLLLPLFQFFWDVLLQSKSKLSHIFREMVKCLSFNIWYVISVLMGITSGFMRFSNHCILFLYTVRVQAILQRPNLLGTGVVQEQTEFMSWNEFLFTIL